MSKTRFTQWIVLACIGSLAACTSGEGDTAGNTEFNVIVPNNESAPGVPAPIDIQTVEYTINCAGNNDTFLDNNASFPDEVVINGNLEVVDGRTSGAPPVPTEIWQGFMDLPPGPCTVQLRARDNDGEVICTATEPFNIAADTTTKVNMVLICDVSYQAPVGMLDVDATFSFNVGNFCPDLFVLNCLESNPPTLIDPFGIGVDLAITQCETRHRDGDSTCGNNCDPQTCVPTPEGLTCTPGPDPGVTTTVTCPGAIIDCDGLPNLPDPIGGQDTSCTYGPGDVTGTIGGGEGTFFSACIPPAFGGTPGAIVTCTAVTTDGDIDCDKTKVVSFTCPGLNFCDEPTTVCDDGNECTNDFCNPVAGPGGGACETTNVPANGGSNCSTAPGGGLGQCDGAGNCADFGCSVDADCDIDGNECTVAPAGACDVGTGLCAAEVNEVDGTSCAGGTGACSAGACVDNCDISVVDCSDGNECTADACDNSTNPGICSNPNEPAGTSCNTGLGTCDGAGSCITLTPFNWAAETNDIDMCCNNNALPQQSIIPIQLTTCVGGCNGTGAGQPFTNTLTGLLTFPESFLDVAQTVVVGGVQQADLIDAQVTVQARGTGATGADVAIPAIFPAGFCLITATACDVANNVPGGGGNTDCSPVGSFNPCQRLVTVPTTASLATCLSLDPPGCTPGTDCTKSDTHALNGFCVTGPLPIPLDTAVGNYTAGPAGSNALFGWADVGVPGTTTVGGVVTIGAPVFSNPTGPNGMKVNASGLAVAIECIMAVETGDLLTDPVTCGSSADALLNGSGTYLVN